MIDWWSVLWSALIGVLLGLTYFGGLWFTVQRLSTARHPALMAFASFLLRIVLLLFTIYWVMDGRFERLVILLVGFFLARQVLLVRLRPGSSREAIRKVR
jgi:F1F0 ATPase subunit 2